MVINFDQIELPFKVENEGIHVALLNSERTRDDAQVTDEATITGLPVQARATVVGVIALPSLENRDGKLESSFVLEELSLPTSQCLMDIGIKNMVMHLTTRFYGNRLYV